AAAVQRAAAAVADAAAIFPRRERAGERCATGASDADVALAHVAAGAGAAVEHAEAAVADDTAVAPVGRRAGDAGRARAPVRAAVDHDDRMVGAGIVSHDAPGRL